jgi:hypothetical protein
VCCCHSIADFRFNGWSIGVFVLATSQVLLFWGLGFVVNGGLGVI